MARILSFNAGLMLVAQRHAEKATRGQIVASDIDLAFRKMRLGSQMLQQKGWLGGFGRNPWGWPLGPGAPNLP